MVIDFDHFVRNQQQPLIEMCSYLNIEVFDILGTDGIVSNRTAQVSTIAVQLIYRATQFKTNKPKLCDILPERSKGILSRAKTLVKRLPTGTKKPVDTGASSTTMEQLKIYFQADLRLLRDKYVFNPAWMSRFDLG